MITVLCSMGNLPKLPEVLEVIEAWGFSYYGWFEWIKKTKTGKDFLVWGIGQELIANRVYLRSRAK